ncbi:hypothetical protein DRQ53_11545 [bacterium]|nr:MAG: hypothetical protein DRQ32_02105 [bacterium]RKZ14444.1 MAG: hypothetical protein DRQ53_11545 [bacterium]
MNKRLLSLAVIGSMLLMAGVASAGIPDDTTSTASSAGGVVMITPSGAGASLASAGATVTVTVLDVGSLPVANYPFQDIWLDDTGDAAISLCQGGSAADANTNASGVTTIGGVISGGGFTQNTQVWIAGTPLAAAMTGTSPALNSPDIDGSLGVDIVDFGTFGADFGSTQFRSDLVFDGVVDISDFGTFGTSFGQVCP